MRLERLGEVGRGWKRLEEVEEGLGAGFGQVMVVEGGGGWNTL